MRSIIVYCAVAAQICSTAVSSAVPPNSEAGVRLPLNNDENNSDVGADIADIFASPPTDSRNAWSKLRNKLVVKIFGSKERHHGSLNHQHLSSSGQKALGDVGAKRAALYTKYQNDVVLRFNISSAEEARALAEATEVLYLDVWSVTKDHADIRVDKDVVQSLLGLLPESLQGAHSRLMHDLAATVRDSFPEAYLNPGSAKGFQSITSSDKYRADGGKIKHFFSDYQPIEVINPWMKLVKTLFSDHVATFTIGKSYEGRPINGLKVSSGAPLAPGTRRKAVIISGASHAREWISVTTICYLAHKFITGYHPSGGSSTDGGFPRDNELTRLVQAFDWYFIPTLNVDGYAYSWSQERLWRKNRQPTRVNFCNGIELDRTYSYKWDVHTHHNPCSENYPGEGPFNATETKLFADWANNLTKDNTTRIVGFLDMHSYSQQILYPYAYTCNERPPDMENLLEMALGLSKAIRMHNQEHYQVASACGTHFGYPRPPNHPPHPKSKESIDIEGDKLHLTETGGGGSALDYFYAQLQVPFAYQVKLRDQGSYGFLLPKEYIRPTGDEMTNMVKHFGKFLIGDDLE